jgi:hypothetical protein
MSSLSFFLGNIGHSYLHLFRGLKDHHTKAFALPPAVVPKRYINQNTRLEYGFQP